MGILNSGFINFIEVVGLISFSISGAMAALDKKLDIFGIFIIAFVTSMGGGTLRDILIGDLPVNWMVNTQNTIIILIAAIVAVLFRKSIQSFQKLLFIFDSLGLGLFTVVGIEKGIAFGFDPGICIMLGTITGCFGGVIRDISINNIPMIFQKEIYATACIGGGILYFILQSHISIELLDIIVIMAIFLFRIWVVKYNISLPDMYRERQS